MRSWAKIAIAGVAAGLVASLAMNRFQAATAEAFGQDDDDGDPATVKVAEDVAASVDETFPDRRRDQAGTLVHYATGIALGVGYVVAAERWPRVTHGFGVGYGVATSLLFDDLAVPALGWGPWPWRSDAGANLYGLSAHVVYGAALEGARRAVLAALD